MMGISYGGISQLFTAQTQPPSLAAISPLSVIDETQTTLYPGGILNTGFAVDWAKERVHDALPAGPNGGQAWAYKRIQDGDQTCKANQALHGEAANLLAKIRANDHYVPKVADPLSPVTFVQQDQRAGLHGLPVDRRADRRPLPDARRAHDRHRRASGSRSPTAPTSTRSTRRPSTAGTTSSSSTSPSRRRSPTRRRSSAAGAGDLPGGDGRSPGVTLPPDPIQQQPTYDGRAGGVRGAASRSASCSTTAPAARSPASRSPASSSPSRASRSRAPTARSWYLAAERRARRRAAGRSAGADAFTWDAHARPLTDFTGDTAARHGRPLDRDAALPVGAEPGRQRRLLRDQPAEREHDRDRRRRRAASGCAPRRPNVDLQATISEVRPDGKETFVQSGWVRGNERKLDRRRARCSSRSSACAQRDVQPLPRRPLRARSRSRSTTRGTPTARARASASRSRAPNGDQPIWSFGETQPTGHANVAIAYSKSMPSRLILPVVPGVNVPTGLPPCPGLRGEPCRDYQPFVNDRG